MFLMAMGILSTALVFTVNNEMMTSAAYKYSQQAYYIASTGVHRSWTGSATRMLLSWIHIMQLFSNIGRRRSPDIYSSGRAGGS